MPFPKITVVTPSYNQGHFIEETILSVLGQNYPNLEYIIMDGGSTDNSVEIIKKHEKSLAYWVSARDGGQGAAINTGFARATGDILCWLNSDDMYMPGVLHKIAKLFAENPNKIVFGNCIHIDGCGASGSNVEECLQKFDIIYGDYIIQPSSFWTRSVWDKVGALDLNMHFAFDWDWFIRAKSAGVEFQPIPDFLSIYRIHDSHKSSTGGDKRQAELLEIYRRYVGEDFYRFGLLYEKEKTSIRRSRKTIGKFRFGVGVLENLFLKIAYPRLFSSPFASKIPYLRWMLGS